MIERIRTKDRKKISKFYDNAFRSGGYDNPERFHNHVMKIIPVKHGRLLDVACGNGNFLEHAEKTYEAYGIDISPEAIKIAKKRAAGSKLRVAPSDNLPFRNGTFDVVTCLGSLEHFEDMGKSLAEMKRVAKENGVIILHVPNSQYLIHKILGVDTQGQINERLATEKEWGSVLGKYLVIKKVYKYNTRWFLGWIPKNYCCHFTLLCEKN